MEGPSAQTNLIHFRNQPGCRDFHCFYQTRSRYLQENVDTTHHTQTQRWTNRHGLIDSETHATQEYKYFIGFVKFPFACYKHYDKTSMTAHYLGGVHRKKEKKRHGIEKETVFFFLSLILRTTTKFALKPNAKLVQLVSLIVEERNPCCK